MKALSALLFALLIIPGISNGQDALFNQNVANPMYFNPAFAGFQQNLRAGLQYRINPGQLTTEALSVDFGFPKISSGVGIMAYHSLKKPGLKISTTSFGLSYACEFQVGEASYLRLGTTVSAHIDSLVNFHRIDPMVVIPPSYTLDLALGALFYNNNFYSGLAVYDIFTPLFLGPSEIVFPGKRVEIQEGGFANVNNFTLNPNLLFTHQGMFNAARAGVNVSYLNFTAGNSFNYGFGNQNSINFLLGLAHGNFKACYNLDYFLQMQGNHSFGYHSVAHEISLVYEMKKPRDTSNKPMIGNLRAAF